VHSKSPNVAIRFAATVLISTLWSHDASAQKRIACPDGDHLEIDLKQITIQYNASSFSATLNGLGLLGGRIQVDQKKLQEATSSTQQWDEYLRGLAVGYNVCAVTKQEFNDGLSRIYPRLQQDAADLDAIRKLIKEGRKADEKRLRVLMDSYLSSLREFKEITEHGDDVRQRGLLLSTQITDFLAERRSYPGCGEPGPGFHAVGNLSLDNSTPPCMKETRRLFVDKFEASIANLHDEFSRRGLQDTILENVYQNLSATAGNVDAMIVEIAESVRKLAKLVPPRDLYVDMSDERLAAIAVDETHTIDEKTKTAMDELEAHREPPDAVRFRFFYDFKECCLNQVEYLRAEILKRLGPSAYDPDEMRAFNGLNRGLTELERQPTGSISTVLNYAPHFRLLAFKLKRKATPLRGPQALHFSATTLPSGNKTFPISVVITIDSPETISSGYVVVLIDGSAASVRSDLEDSELVMDGKDVVENRQLSQLLVWNPGRITYAIKIGKTPFYKGQPIHVATEGKEQIHVSRVLYFEE
jgi:hypothetical protein